MRYQYFKSYVHMLLGLSLLLAISACREAPPPPPERIRAIKTITVSEQAAGKLRQFSGVVEVADSSSISFEVAGNVREVRVDVGDRINKGQVQAVLDKRTYNLNVKAAEAEVGRAKVKLAVILAFGLAAGTVLTLAVAPVLYTLFFRVKVP